MSHIQLTLILTLKTVNQKLRNKQIVSKICLKHMKSETQSKNDYQLIDIHQRQTLENRYFEQSEDSSLTENTLEKENDKKSQIENSLEQENDQESFVENKEQIWYRLKLHLLKNTFFQMINEKQTQIWTIICISITLLVWILHQSMKTKCPFGSDHSCLKKFIIPRLKQWIPFVLINSSCILIHVHILVEKKTHRLFPLIALCSIFYILREQQISLTYYIGAINALHYIFTGFFFLAYVFIRMWIFCFKKNKRVCLVGNFLVIISFILIMIFFKIENSCDYWTQGINGEIDHEINPFMCQIQTPTYCWYKITDGWQDLSYFLRPSCRDFLQNSSSFTKIFDSHFQKSVGQSQFVGYQNLNQASENDRMDINIQKTVFNEAKGYSNLLDAQKAGHDVVFDRKNKVYNIEIQRNETLVKEREKLQNKSSLAKNILLIFVDAISRQSMHLKLPKTTKWFQQRTQYHSYVTNNHNQTTKKNISEGESYEFYRYNSLKSFTYNNLQTLLYGNTSDDLTLEDEQKWQGIIEEFKQKGYLTGHSSDICQLLALGFNSDIRKMSTSLRYDHETQSFACDPNYQDPKSNFGLFQGPYSIIDRCLYGRSLGDLSLDYAKSFFQTYKNEQKFMHVEFQYGHEGTGEVIRHLDEPIYQFLEQSSLSGLLDDTVVILISDHGLHMHGLFYLMNLENVFIEINLPGLFIHLPQSMNALFRKEISENQQNLVSIKNLHHFLKDIIYGKNENSTLSLLSSLKHQVSCISLDINDPHCSCL